MGENIQKNFSDGDKVGFILGRRWICESGEEDLWLLTVPQSVEEEVQFLQAKVH